jgi:AbrB family looped-hinge helix DNA binding protein
METYMKKLARITAKGQITLPNEVRRALGVGAGDRLLFEKDGASFRVKPVRANSPFEKYRGIDKRLPRTRKSINRRVRAMRGC